VGVERTAALIGTWQRVNEIGDTTQDANEIRALIGEAGIVPNMHVGISPADFTRDMVCEWVLGQWADVLNIANGEMYLNSVHNLSLVCYEQFLEEFGSEVERD
jgi:hypothetical protein